MSTHWSRAEDLFLRAVELEADEQEVFLAHECGDDDALRAVVDALLAADRRATGLLDRPPPLLGSGEETLAEPMPTPCAEGQRIDRYRIVRPLGRGGMAVVYLAVREHDYRQQVALKVFAFGVHRPDLLRRFHHERQILADLEHPGIARLLDGGATPEGLPYLVMERVEGEPIDTYCDHHRLAVADRLTLFRRLAEAVHYAHQRLVVHRDIKPSNVLVTPEGQPKLLDFGIAKLLAPSAGRESLETMTGQHLMTPAYASPEQLRGETITTASDVYSMGVLLYHLLAGRAPHKDWRRRSGSHDSTTEADSVTVALRRPPGPGEASTEELAAARNTTAARLRRQLRGDLETIVDHCLRPEPSRRYGSVEQLSEDLRRYAAGQPIVARSDHLAYVAWKLAGRHRRTLALVLALTLVALGVVTERGIQSRRLALEREHSMQATELVVGLFEGLDPSQAKGSSEATQQLLDQLTARLDDLAGQPALLATVHEAIGRTYRSLGRLGPAREHLWQAMALYRLLPDSGRWQRIATLNALAEVQRDQGAFVQARALNREALALTGAPLGEETDELARTYCGLGSIARDLGDLGESVELLRHSLAIIERVEGEDHLFVAEVSAQLARSLELQGPYPEAETLYRRALTIRRRHLEAPHKVLVQSLEFMAEILRLQGEYGQAIPFVREALAMARQLYGDHHPEIATTLSFLGALAANQGDLDTASEAFEEALTHYLETLGPDHPWIATTLHNLATIQSQKGEHDAAARSIERAIELRQRTGGDHHPSMHRSLNLRGMIALAQGHADEAETFLRQALALGEEIFPGDHGSQALALHNLGRVMDQQGRDGEAETLWLEAQAIQQRLFGDDHPDSAMTAIRLAERGCRRGASEEGASEEGARRAGRALEVLRRKLPAGHVKIADAESVLGLCRTLEGRFDAAEPLLLASYPVLLAYRGHPETAQRVGLVRLVALYTTRGDDEKARQYRAELEALML